MSSISDVFTVEQAAERLRVSIRRVQEFCRTGRLGQKLGGRYLIEADELVKFKQTHREPGNPSLRKPKQKRDLMKSKK